MSVPDHEGAWPPAFSDAFVESTRSLFVAAGHLSIIGPVGSNRGLLASLVADVPEETSVWWRSDGSTVRPKSPYAAVNHVIPALRAPADAPIDAVVERASAVVGADPSSGPPPIILREADLSDAESIEVLTRLAALQRIRLVKTAGPGFLDHPAVTDRTAVVELEPLSDDAIAGMLAQRFGARAHPTTVAMLSARSQGAYGVLREIAEIEHEAGRLAVVSGVLVPFPACSEDAEPAPGRGTRRWANRYAADAQVSDLVEVAALVLALCDDEATDTFGARAVRTAVEMGAIRRSSGLLRFSSHAEATLLQRLASVPRRRELFDTYAPSLPRSLALPAVAGHVATWRLSIGAPIDATLALHACNAANREGRYSRVLRIADAVPATERPSRLLVETAHALHETGGTDALVDLLRDLDAPQIAHDDQLPLLRWASQHLEPAAFATLQRRFVDAASGDPTRLGSLQVVEMLAGAHRDGSDGLGRRLRALVDDPRLTPLDHAMALVALGMWSRHAGRAAEAVKLTTEAVAHLDAQHESVCAWHHDVATETLVLASIAAIDLDAAEIALSRYSSAGALHGHFGRLGLALWGVLAFFRGDLRAALADLDVALRTMPAADPHGARAWIEGLYAQAVAQVGDVDLVEGLLRAARARPPARSLQHELERRIAEACADDSLGDAERALETLGRVIATAREHDLHHSEVDAAVLCVQIGGPAHSHLLLRATEDLVEPSGTAALWKRFADALRTNTMAALVELAEEMHAVRAQVFAAEIARFTLDVSRRASDMTAEQRDRLSVIADPMAHRHVTR